jgi:hypothetical protein
MVQSSNIVYRAVLATLTLGYIQYLHMHVHTSLNLHDSGYRVARRTNGEIDCTCQSARSTRMFGNEQMNEPLIDVLADLRSRGSGRSVTSDQMEEQLVALVKTSPKYQLLCQCSPQHFAKVGRMCHFLTVACGTKKILAHHFFANGCCGPKVRKLYPFWGLTKN